MRVLLYGGAAFTKTIVNKLIGKAGHTLDCRKQIDPDTLEVSGYDMMLVDGFPGECNKEKLTDVVQTIRTRAPELPIVVLSYVDGAGAIKGCGTPAGHSCRVVESSNGMTVARCRLQELALNDVEAMMLNVFDRLPIEPITFEYQGNTAKERDGRITRAT